MKIRNLMWVVIVNIFLMLAVSVIMEYSSLDSRFEQLQNTVSLSLDTAITTSMKSEEFFSSDYDSITTSQADKYSYLRVLGSENSWVSGNAYVMSMYYQANGRFPATQYAYNTYENSNGDEASIYRWLFGGTGTAYKYYSWANNGTKLWSQDLSSYGTNRTPTANFKNFYNSIGKYMVSTAYIKQKNGSGYVIVEKEIPTLTQTGLILDSTYNGNASGGSTYTSDYLSSVVHFGKSASGIATTKYYLTPYSLGVTYVPTEVLKPVFLAHLDTLVRFNKVKHTVTGNSADFSDFRSADGCISTSVYDSGNVKHNGGSSSIINDGEIEYDLSTVKVKVDYFLVDFYNNANYRIVNRIEGSTSKYNASGGYISGSNITTLPSRLKATDTSIINSSKKGNRIVAKVSVKLKVNIPYESAILQWFRYLTDTDGINHFDIKLWNEQNDYVDFNSDGVWFYYTTYTAISR